MTARWLRSCLLTLGIAGLIAPGAAAQTGDAAPGGWTCFGGTRAFTRYAPLDQIDRTNVFGGIQENMWGPTFRAYDKATGTVVWETELPAGTTGGPMTCVHEGRQYIVVPVGGRDRPAEWVALALS